MDAEKPKANNPMDRFTQAVRTIVNVPKNKTVKGKSGLEYETRTCPKCGKQYIVMRGKLHKHED